MTKEKVRKRFVWATISASVLIVLVGLEGYHVHRWRLDMHQRKNLCTALMHAVSQRHPVSSMLDECEGPIRSFNEFHFFRIDRHDGNMWIGIERKFSTFSELPPVERVHVYKNGRTTLYTPSELEPERRN
jgi:hypothetical protein